MPEPIRAVILWLALVLIICAVLLIADQVNAWPILDAML
jgi:hypothetical protein